MSDLRFYGACITICREHRIQMSDTYCEVDQSNQPRSHVSCQLPVLVSASNNALGRFTATELPTDRHVTTRHQKIIGCRYNNVCG